MDRNITTKIKSIHRKYFIHTNAGMLAKIERMDIRLNSCLFWMWELKMFQLAARNTYAAIQDEKGTYSIKSIVVSI